MPSLIDRIAARLGFQPRAAVERQVTMAAIAAGRRVARAAGQHQRSLLASLTTPDVASWQDDGAHINTESAAGLAVVRSRSRHAARNNEHARRFLGMVRSNVLGPFGVRYQARLRKAAGTLRDTDNSRLESGWLRFSQRGACDITGRYSLRDIERLVLRHVAVDGEVFLRQRPGRGPHGLLVQLLTADACPLGYSADLGGGRRIRQGVEFDADGRVLAYHLRSDDTTLDMASVLGAVNQHRLVRVPAAEILHLMLPEEAGQLRGVPWMQAALKRMYQASDFATAGLNKARESAKRIGFVTQDKDAAGPPDLPGVQPGADDGSAAPVDTGVSTADLVDGQWEKLLPGESFVGHEGDYPNIEYGQFIKDCVRGIAAALDVAYITLGNDLEAVNYSSGQLGLEGERTMWRGLQEWLIESLHTPLQRWWLTYGLVAAPELSALAYDRLDQYAAAARWVPHRWQPLDPIKTIESQRSRIEARLTSPQRVMEEAGDDPDEVIAELLEWQDKTAGLRPAVPPKPGAAPAPAEGDDGAARQALRLRLIANAAD